MEAAEEQFPVFVSLERYFPSDDVRAHVVAAAHRGRPARWLLRRLRRAYRLPRPAALLVHRHLLPPHAPLSLLRRGARLQVVPITAEEAAALDYEEKRTKVVNGCESSQVQRVAQTMSTDEVDMHEVGGGASESPLRARSPAVVLTGKPGAPARGAEAPTGEPVAPTVGAATPNGAPEAQHSGAAPDSHLVLEEMKRHALALLDQAHTDTEDVVVHNVLREDITCETDRDTTRETEDCQLEAPCKRRRRRVRRRRGRVYNAAPAYDAAPAHDAAPAQQGVTSAQDVLQPPVHDAVPVHTAALVHDAQPARDVAPAYNAAPEYDAKPAYDAAKDSDSSCPPDPDESLPPHTAAGLRSGLASPTFGSGVVRAAAGRRAPRLVRPLSPRPHPPALLATPGP